jgi:hypothetical protein
MSNNILKIMEAYKSMVSEGKELDEMRGATAGRRQSKVFPLNKKGEAEAFAKKHGGKVEKKGASLYVTWDIPESVEEASFSEKKNYEFKNGKVYISKADFAKVHPDNKNDTKGKERMSVLDPKTQGTVSAPVVFKEELELEEKKLDPVNDKENDKEFKDRKDKDIDNDGDVDSSDEYLHKRRKATDDAIDSKKEEKEEDEVEEPKEPAPKKKPSVGRTQSTKDIKHNDHTSDKKAEISKIESVDTREAFIAMWSELEEAVNQKKGATAPEEIDSKESPKSKEFIAKHKQSDKKIEDGEEEGHEMATKAGRVTKQAPNRGNDNLSNGDKTPVKGK